MKYSEWFLFERYRNRYRAATVSLDKKLPQLRKIQQQFVDNRQAEKTGNSNAKTNSSYYMIETPIVYNQALDDVKEIDDIRLILVADNPGRREQAAENRCYLVGPSGKIAEKFFRDNPSLGIDFRRNVIILNKTPIHSPRTTDLYDLCRMGGETLTQALLGSQREMAQFLFDFHDAFSKTPVQVWIIGYSEMKKGGIFEAYTETLRSLYTQKSAAARANNIFLFRHFSMNQFTIDLKQKSSPKKSLEQNLADIGTAYRKRILGW